MKITPEDRIARKGKIYKENLPLQSANINPIDIEKIKIVLTREYFMNLEFVFLKIENKKAGIKIILKNKIYKLCKSE